MKEPQVKEIKKIKTVRREDVGCSASAVVEACTAELCDEDVEQQLTRRKRSNSIRNLIPLLSQPSLTIPTATLNIMIF